MKHLNLTTLMLILMCVFISCDKQTETELNTENLTPCKEGYSCTYSFYKDAMLETDGSIKKGGYRIFQSKNSREAITSLLTIEVRSSATSFTLGKTEINNGQVKPGVICVACDYLLLKPVDGLITGRRISDTKWLLDISVIMANPVTGKIADTVETKQVFTLGKL